MSPFKLGQSIVLGLFALMNLAGGGIPAFSPDGVAGTIAGLGLGTSADRTFFLFALIWVGLVAVHEVRGPGSARASGSGVRRARAGHSDRDQRDRRPCHRRYCSEPSPPGGVRPQHPGR